MTVGFVRHSVSGNTIVLGGGGSVAPDESPPVVSDRRRLCPGLSGCLVGY